MTIIVTEHAIDRYAERIVAIQPETLSHRERNVIANAIRSTVAPRVCKGVRQLKTADVVYVMDGDTVVTVKARHDARRNWRSFKGLVRGVPA